MFKFDGPLFKFLNRVFDVILLSIIWGFCSIPIFTIGASTTALYYTMLKILKDEEGYVTTEFFTAFKLNFKQATIIWIILLIFGWLLGSAGLRAFIFWSRGLGGEVMLISLYFTVFMGILYFMVLLYIFPLLAKFENNTRNLLKLSLLLAIKHLLWTIVMICVVVVITTLAYVIPFFAMFYIGLIAFFNCFIINHIFSKYNREDTENTK